MFQDWIQLDRRLTIIFVSKEQEYKKIGYQIGDFPVLITKTIAIKKTIWSAPQMENFKIIVENDSKWLSMQFMIKPRFRD